MQIISKRDSGLGDMLSNLTHCMWLSEHLEASLFVDWRVTQYHDLKNKGVNFFPEFFQLNFPYANSSLEEIDSSGIVLPYGSSLINEPEAKHHIEPQLLETFGLTGLVPKFNAYVTTRPQDLLSLNTQFEYLRMIEVVDGIKQDCDKILNNARKKSTYIYAVHIRHGNGELYPAGSDAEKKLFELYKTQITEIQKQMDVRFFLFTDSQTVVDWFSENIEEPFMNPNVCFPKSFGKAMHHNQNIELYGYNILKWAVEDMYLMSQLDGLIYDTWSSFVRWPRANGSNLFNRNLHGIRPPRIAIPAEKKITIKPTGSSRATEESAVTTRASKLDHPKIALAKNIARQSASSAPKIPPKQIGSIPMTSRDVISAYKLFLNRIPESEEVVNARVGLSDFELLSHFLSSDEFIKNPKNEALILEVVSNLLRRLKNSQNQITAIKENP